MHNIFKINGEGILTFKDLQSKCAPQDLYKNLSDFILFASVHCEKLPLMVTYNTGDIAERKAAEFLTKKFWMNVLRLPEWPQDSDKDGENIILFADLIAEDVFLGKIKVWNLLSQSEMQSKTKQSDDSQKEQTEKFQKEYQALQVKQKLERIIKVGELNSSSVTDARKAVALLAICELAEIDALSAPFAVAPKTTDISKQQIVEISSASNLPLAARDVPYQYWYHSSDKLEDGETIQTVCICAKAWSEDQTSVIIQLYDDNTKECIHTVTLAPGEFRYCNVAGGKVIKFLPTISMSPNAYLYRKNLSDSDITVCTENVSWKLNADNVSSFAIADNDNYILVQKGKLNIESYRKAKNDYLTMINLNLIFDTVVEVQLTENGYKILTSKGEVKSDISAYQSEQGGVVSLDPYSRLPMPKTNLYKDNETVEVSVGSDEDCIMLRPKEGQEPIAFFRSQNKHLKINNDIKNGVEILVEEV